jgi:NodT family efflux transporter outer membrane factor (OMF) lipoprotein
MTPIRRSHARMNTQTAERSKKHSFAEIASSTLALGAAMLMGACSLGPKYHVPPTPAPPAYKELTPDSAKDTDGWKQAQPQDSAIHSNWWEVFNDPELNSLEAQVNVSNQNIAAAFAGFLQARALVKQARSQYFPTVSTNPSITTNRQSPNLTFGASPSGSTSSGASGKQTTSAGNTYADYSLPFDASWTPDLWGRVRNNVRANVASAQASAADLENTRLTIHAEVAVDYFELRDQDELKQLLDSTVVAYRESLKLTQALYETGIDSDESVAQAETQLETTEAQATNVGIARAQYEHAIAMLVGQPASAFSVPVAPLTTTPPAIPYGVPSQLLERRPDVSANERLMEQANAQIGIAKAAYFPTITLSGTGGFESSSITNWLTWPSRFWSAGPALAETIFDAGLRRATVQQYQAAFDQTVANYRQTVLTAFQQVEDNLAAVRILSQELRQQDAAVNSAQRNLQLATDRYKLGIDPYLNVITAQTTLLGNQQTAVNLRMQQLTDSVQLIEALGGGWDTSQLPSGKQLIAKTPPSPAP